MAKRRKKAQPPITLADKFKAKPISSLAGYAKEMAHELTDTIINGPVIDEGMRRVCETVPPVNATPGAILVKGRTASLKLIDEPHSARDAESVLATASTRRATMNEKGELDDYRWLEPHEKLLPGDKWHYNGGWIDVPQYMLGATSGELQGNERTVMRPTAARLNLLVSVRSGHTRVDRSKFNGALGYSTNNLAERDSFNYLAKSIIEILPPHILRQLQETQAQVVISIEHKDTNAPYADAFLPIA